MATSIIEKPLLENNILTKLSIPANGSTSYLLPYDGQYIICGSSFQVSANSFMYLLGGYVSASRFRVTKIQESTSITIDTSNTQNRTIVISSTLTFDISVNIYLLIRI